MQETPDQSTPADQQMVVADMLFGLAAILLIVVAIASQTIGSLTQSFAGESATTEKEIEQAIATFAHQQGETLLFATADGLRVIRPQGIETVAQGAVATWAPTDLGEEPTIVVSPQGMETDFLLGAVLTRAGYAQVARLRVTGDCQGVSRTTNDAIQCVAPND